MHGPARQRSKAAERSVRRRERRAENEARRRRRLERGQAIYQTTANSIRLIDLLVCNGYLPDGIEHSHADDRGGLDAVRGRRWPKIICGWPRASSKNRRSIEGMNAYRTPAPELDPDRSHVGRPAQLARSITYAAAALARAEGNARAATQGVSDRGALQILGRAATTPATTTGITTFNQTTIAYLSAILGGPSAANAIIARATKVEFGTDAAAWVPGIATDPTNVGFLGEASPLRVRMFDLSAGELDAAKACLRCGAVKRTARQ